MAFTTVFKRYELKYLLTSDQRQRILSSIEPYMAIDKYGLTTIRNLYFDTPDYRLIRHSIEKPTYKEKLRLRSYCTAKNDSTVFAELKKKYEHVVYKRRIPLKERDAVNWLCEGVYDGERTQIFREIEYFLNFYGELRPTVFLSYDREAFYERNGGDFRVTFDRNIMCRENDLSLCSDAYGERLLEDGAYLMELKCSGGIPLWMARILSENRIYKASFSKYGTAYTRVIYPRINQRSISEREKENFPYECV